MLLVRYLTIETLLYLGQITINKAITKGLDMLNSTDKKCMLSNTNLLNLFSMGVST